MASISAISRTHFHARSISLPSRSNIQISDFDNSEATTSSSSSFGLRVNGLRDLYNSVDNLLHLPNTQRSLAQECQKDVNEVLDELLRLLDLCSTAKDVLLTTMRSAQELQSVLLRKRGDPISLTRAVQEYQLQRKTVKKVILKVKVLRDLKRFGSIKHIYETPAVVSLQEVESVTFRVFESLLCFVLGSNSHENSKKWSLVSKLIGAKHVECKMWSSCRRGWQIRINYIELFALIVFI